MKFLTDISFVVVDILQQEVENGKWLRHAEAGFSSDFKRLCSEHVDGTCQWFLQNTKVEHWMGSHSVPGLWVSGKPGCGKSTMASQLIHNLATSPLLVVRMLCKAGMENRCDVLSILRNILFQLVESAVTAVEKRKLHSIITSERMNSKDSFATSIPNLWSALRQLLQSTGGCVCVIDGLDECSNTEQEINDFIVKLTDVFGVSPTTKAVVFSRLGIPSIGDSVCLWECLSITVENVEDDIERFVSVKLEASPKLKNPKVKDRLFKPLIHGSEGMVLWTRLMISELESNHYQVEKVLKEPPAGLKALYKGILQRLSNTGSESLRQQNTHALRLVLAAARPLHLNEFSFAVEMLKGLPNHLDYDPGKNDARNIINGVAPLIIIAPDNTVQIVHASLKDFLVTSSYDRDSGLGYSIFRPSELHGPVTIALLSYLAFPCFSEELVEDPVEINDKYPLLEYSSSQLIWHITKVDDSYQECLHQLGVLFKSTEGWRWLQRLLYTYNVSMGHLQIFQSELKHWLNALSLKTMLDRDIMLDRDVCDDFLVYLCKMRSNQARQCEADHNVSAREAISTLAEVYACQGWWKEAEELQVQVMETRKRVLGQEHSDTLLSMGSLAVAYLNQGRWKEAEELEVQVMETRKRVLGQEHPHTLMSMGSLALGYQNQGRWKEAEELQVQVMETRKRVLGQEHPHTFLSMGNLAAGYLNQGRWKEAEELDVQVVETRKRVLGQEHPDTLSSMGNLAAGYLSQGRWKEAEELEVQVMETRKRVLGQEHPHTLLSMGNLAEGYRNQGRWKEAEELQIQVMETRKRVLGQEHRDTLLIMGNLAEGYRNQGRWKEAEELQVQVMETRKRVLGQEHPDTLMSMGYLALGYQNQGRWKEAEELQVQVMETRKRVLGQEHPDTFLSMANLASMFKSQGRRDEAITLLEQVVDLLPQRLGEDHPHSKLWINTLKEWRDNRNAVST